MLGLIPILPSRYHPELLGGLVKDTHAGALVLLEPLELGVSLGGRVRLLR